MIFAARRIVSGPWIREARFNPVNLSQKYLPIFRRWNTSQTTGVAPPQLPVMGELSWPHLKDNVVKVLKQPPLSPADFKMGKELADLRREFDRMQKIFSDSISSNEALRKDVKDLIARLDFRG